MKSVVSPASDISSSCELPEFLLSVLPAWCAVRLRERELTVIRAPLIARAAVDRAPRDDACECGFVPVRRECDEVRPVLLAWVADQPAHLWMRVVRARDSEGERGEAL